MTHRILLLLAALLLSAAGHAQNEPVDYIVAKVNDDVILASELRSTYDTLAAQYAAQGNPLPPLAQIERQLLDRMILNRVQLQRAEQAGIEIEEDMVDRAMADLAARNNLSLNAFARQLRADGLSYLDLRRQVREEMVLGRLRNREVESRVAVSERDVDTALSLGLADADTLHPMQAAFVRHDGFQCGFCTPGQIMSAVGMLAEVQAGMPSHVSATLDSVSLNEEEISERMSGNLCRCSAYPNIIDAIADVAALAPAIREGAGA